MGSMGHMAVRHLRVVCGLFVLSAVMGFGRFAVMFRGCVVVSGGRFVVVRRFEGTWHGISLNEGNEKMFVAALFVARH